MLIQIHPDNPDPRKIQSVVEIIENGGVIIYPTDTIYGLGCDINNAKAIERIARIKKVKAEKSHFSFVCADLSHASDYVKIDDNHIFRLMRKCLPGAFTFILPAKTIVPKLLKSKKKTVGIRIPDNNVALEIVRILGRPIISTSLHDDDHIIEYPTDPELIYEKYQNLVDAVIDSGIGGNVASTVVDCTNGSPVILRQGKGELLD